MVRKHRRFGELLTEGIKRLALKRRQSIEQTHNELINELSVSRSTIYNWRKGEHLPEPDVIARLAHIFVQKGNVDQTWIDDFLDAAEYGPLRAIEALNEELFGRTISAEIEPAPVVPVQEQKPPLDKSEPLLRSPIQTWTYDAEDAVVGVAVSADGKTVVAGTLGKNVLAFDANGQERWQAKVGNQAWRTAISNDGQTIVVGTGSTRPWDLSGRGLFCFTNEGSLRWQVDLGASVWGLALAADGNTIAVGTSSQQLIVFDDQGHRLWEQKVPGFGPFALVWSTALSADGRIVVAGAADKRLRLFERSGAILVEHQTRGDVFTVAVSADGEAVAAGDGSGTIYWLNRQGQLLWQQQLADKVWATVINTEGSRLLVGAGEKEVHIHAYDQGGRLLWRRHVGGDVSNLALNATGELVAVSTRSGGIYIFGEEGKVLHQHQVSQSVRDVAMSAGGEYVVAGAEDGRLYGFRLHDPADDEPPPPTQIAISQPSPSNSHFPKDRAEQLKRQLPLPTYTRLFGVESFTDELLSCLRSPQQHPIITVQGIGGIGKTALADYSVRRLIEQADTLHDLVWISAKQKFLTGSGIVDYRTQINLERVFDDLGQKLDLNDVLRLPLPQKIDRIATVLRQVPYLVIIDNLETVQDFQGLAPWLEKLARPTTFLLTSREYVPALTTVTPLHLGELNQAASLALIQHTAQEKSVTDLESERVYDLVGGNPLALILLVSQMQYVPPETVLEGVKQGTAEDIYKFVYQKSWLALTNEAREVLLAIQRVNDQANWTWLYEMLDQPEQDLQDALQLLHNLSLVQIQRSADTDRLYTIHRLTATFLRTEVLGWK